MFSSLLGALAFSGLAWASPLIKRASLQQVTDFGSNPSGTQMYIYVPTKLAANPPIIVAIHYCTGSAQAYYTGSPYASLADQYGFIVIYPSSPYSGTCWDVSSQAALTHNGGGDSNSIANMVTYTLAQYNGDASKVFVTGSSSGAMMTNVMAATYPELFAAATAYSGVPAGCFVSTYGSDADLTVAGGSVDAWNSSCASGLIDATPAYWTNVVDNMYPGYTGPRPRFQVYHGTADTILLPPNYNETVKEWTGVFGYDYQSPQTIEVDFPAKGYTTDIWGASAANPLGTVQGIYAIGVGHTVPINGTQDMMWFGLGPYASAPATPPSSSSVAPPPPASTTSAIVTTAPAPVTTTSAAAITTPAPITTSAKPVTTSAKPTTAKATTTAAAAGTIAKWGQCGGIGWTGKGSCVSGSTCKAQNSYYSQCL